MGKRVGPQGDLVYKWHWDDPCTDDSLVFEFDLHYRIDKPGSRQEYVK